jgi:hypothetical protein
MTFAAVRSKTTARPPCAARGARGPASIDRQRAVDLALDLLRQPDLLLAALEQRQAPQRHGQLEVPLGLFRRQDHRAAAGGHGFDAAREQRRPRPSPSNWARAALGHGAALGGPLRRRRRVGDGGRGGDAAKQGANAIAGRGLSRDPSCRECLDPGRVGQAAIREGEHL